MMVKRFLGLLMLVALSGCGVVPQSHFDNALLGVDGEPVTTGTLRAIVDDGELTVDQKRDAFRDLGILDEKLIDSLLGL